MTTRALEMAVDAGRQAGLDITGARIHRVQSSIHVELPQAEALARVESSGRDDVARRQVRIARAWARTGAPIASLIRGEIQPFIFRDGAVTIWRRLDHTGAVDLAELGRTIRILHSKSQGLSLEDLPRIDPLADVGAWVHSSGDWLGPDDRSRLACRLESLASWWKEFVSDGDTQTTLVHGDVHRENALKTKNGIILIDIEDAGVGPPDWDLVPLAVGVRRYGDPESEFERFISGYGEDPRTRPSFDTLCEIYEMTVTLWATHCGDATPSMAEEAKIRVEGFLGRSRVPWTLC